MNEICKDGDSYAKSYYFYKSGAIVHGGPLWDKNKSFGNVTSRGTTDWYVNTTDWLYQKNTGGNWVAALMTNSDYCAIIWDLWVKFYKTGGGAFSYSEIETFVNKKYNYLDTTGMLSNNKGSGPNPLQPWETPYLNAKNNVLAYLNGGNYNTSDGTKAPVSTTDDSNTGKPIGRLAWIDQNLAALLKSTSGFIPPAG